MAETGFKFRILFIFVVLLTIGLLLQSIVVMFLGLQASIKEDVIWTKRFLQMSALRVPLEQEVNDTPNQAIGFDKIPEEYDNILSCLVVEVAGMVVSESSQCRFRKEMANLSQQAKVMEMPVTGYAGDGWRFYLFGSEVAHVAVPLVDNKGQVYGSICAERSLLPIYYKYRNDMKIAFCYLLVNVIVFSIVGFFRFVRICFRPLDNLMQMAENYQPDEQSLLPFSEDKSVFRKLSLSLNELLDRIKRDNRMLRKTVLLLEQSNRELKENKDLVVRSEKLASVGRLSAGLAHEIGNPLSIIQGYVELLGREDLSQAEKSLFSAKAQQELERIRKLIKQLLEFSRPKPAVEDEVAVNATIDEVISFLALENASHSGLIRNELRAEDDRVVAEKDALRQVLINVIFNAIDATAGLTEMSQEIVVSTNNENSSTLGPVVVISVKDNGIGIEKEHLQEVFDPFFTTKQVGRGTGLGLYVCHTILDHLGGHISIDNRVPAGVEVKIELPLRRKASSSVMDQYGAKCDK